MLIVIFVAFAISLTVVSIPLKEIERSTIIYDRNNIEIGEIPFDDRVRHRPLTYAEIPDLYKEVLIYWEDRSFYQNYGISIRGLVRSFLNNLSDNPVQGGSTISAQFIRNNLWLNEKRGFIKKIREFYYSLVLNLRYSKDEILEKYANQVYFGYMNHGLGSASSFFFGKEPKNLTDAEIIALFAIQKNSSRYDPYLNNPVWRQRFEMIAQNLKANQIITPEEFDSMISEKISFRQDHKNQLPYVADFIKRSIHSKIPFIRKMDISGKSVVTTFDFDLTKKLEKIGENAIYELAWKNVKDYSMIVADRKTHEILVMIGGKDYHSKEGQVNSVLALRQPGSTIKPFTYLLADKMFSMKPSDGILDLPVSYKTKDGFSYEPKNYSTRFEGEVSIGEALAQSMNVPAVRVLEKVGVDKLLQFLRSLGMSSLTGTAENYGLALTLGDGEVSLYELLRAYSIFSGDGTLCDFIFIRGKNPDCRMIIEKTFTDDINSILSSRFLKIGGYPINSALDFEDINVFFKTGTSRNYRDNWTIGYTDNYMIGVWTGNKDASNMKGVSGATGAGEIFSRVVRTLEKPGSRKTEPKIMLNSKKYLEITSPLPGQLFKINRYQPHERQKIKLEFSTNLPYNKAFWYLDGVPVTGGFVDLSAGMHSLKLELIDKEKITSRSEQSFEVISED